MFVGVRIMKLSKFLTPVFVAGLSIFISAQAFAANKVFWDGQTLNGIAKTSDETILADSTALSEIGKAFDTRLGMIQLPFELGVRNDQLKTASASAFMEMPEEYALIPVVLDDSTYESWYEAENTKYYKTIVRTNISVLLCGYGGSMGDKVNFLYNIPLSGYGVVRTKGNSPTTAQLRQQFISNAVQLINKRFFVPPNIVNFMNPKFGKTKTYQVDTINVDVSAKKNFDEVELSKEIIPYVASSYTTAYAALHPELVVLPDKIHGKNWQQMIAKHINSNLVEVDMLEEGFVKPIRLELMNYSLQKVKDSTRTKDASFFDKYILKVGMKNLNNGKTVQPFKEFQIPNNIPSKAEISLPTFYGYAARILAKEK